jgi:hypothetical protein
VLGSSWGCPQHKLTRIITATAPVRISIVCGFHQATSPRHIPQATRSTEVHRRDVVIMSLAKYLVALVVLLAFYSIRKKRRTAKLPPGPPRLPIIGNLHQAPSTTPWLTFQKWVDQYGPLVSVDFGGTNVVIIGSYDIARDLLDKRANIYSSRPRLVCTWQPILFECHVDR